MREIVRLAFEYVKESIDSRIFSKKELVFEQKPLFPLVFGIDHHWDIKVIANPDADVIFDEIVKENNIDYKMPILPVMEWGLNHEKGHWDHCPFDVYNLERIFNGTVRAFNDMGKDYKKELMNVKNMMNMFMDIIDNTSNIYNNISSLYKEGFDIFYLTDATFQKRMLKRYSTASELFTSTQYALFGDDSEIEQAVRSYNKFNIHTKGIKKYLNKVQKLSKKNKTFIKDLDSILRIYTPTVPCLEKVRKGKIIDRTKEQILRYIRNPKKWEEMAYDFTNVMYKHMKDMQHEQPSNKMIDQLIETIEAGQDAKEIGKDYDGQRSESDKGKGGDDDGKKDRKDTQKSDEERGIRGKATNSRILEKALKDMKEKHQNLEHTLNDQYLKMLVSAGREKGADIHYTDKFMFFDTLYQERAEDIVLDFNGKFKESDVTRLAFYNHEPAARNIDLSRVDFSKTRILRTPEKKIILYEGDIEEVSDDPVIYGRGKNFDILWIIDSSGSMSAGYWNDIEQQLKQGVGKYDLLLRSMYSSIRYLEGNGKAYRMNFGLVNFAGDTRFSGWHDYSELDEVKKAAFRYQGGGTVLSPNILDKVCKTRKDNFLAFLMTDGDLDNPENAAKALKKMIGYGNPLVLCYIDSNKIGHNNLMRKMGDSCRSHAISNPDDLIDLKLKTTEEVWGEMGDIFSYD